MSTTTAPAATRIEPTVKRSRRHKVGQEKTNWTATVLLLIAALTVLVPLYVTVSMAFKTTKQSTDGNAFSFRYVYSISICRDICHNCRNSVISNTQRWQK
jgi:ABC-type glycerol-3-phosphate transport system permease component